MPNFLSILIKYHHKNNQRAREFFFLKACMAASAVVAVADGFACQREALAVKTVMNTLDELKIFDSKHGSEIYRDFLKQLEKDPEAGLAAAMKCIEGVKDDDNLTLLLVMICQTISEADGIVRPEEVDAIDHICGLLHVESSKIKALEVDFRAEIEREKY